MFDRTSLEPLCKRGLFWMGARTVDMVVPVNDNGVCRRESDSGARSGRIPVSWQISATEAAAAAAAAANAAAVTGTCDLIVSSAFSSSASRASDGASASATCSVATTILGELLRTSVRF